VFSSLDASRPTLTQGRRALTALAAAAVLAGASTGVAHAETASGTTVANVVVQSAISLSALTPSFDLTGLPGATATGAAAVSMLVTTNNQAGYAVTVQARTATLRPANTTTNTDSIPIGNLGVRETGTTDYTPVSSTAPVTVHSQTTRSAQGGDTIRNDYQVEIPFVNSDTYSVTLDYIATTL